MSISVPIDSVQTGSRTDAGRVIKSPFDKPEIKEFQVQQTPSPETGLPAFDENIPFEEYIPPEEPLPPFDENLPVVEEDNPERAFGAPSRADRERLFQAFTSDPMTVIGDSETRTYLSNLFSKYDKPETEKRKIALAAYFADMNLEKVSFIYDNLDNHLEQFFKRKISVDEAYQEIGSFLALAKPGMDEPENTNTSSEYGSAVKSGVSRVVNSIANFGITYEKLLSAPTVSLLNDTQRDEVFGWKERHLEEWAAYQKAEYEKMNLPEDWLTNSGSTGEWFVNFGKFLTVEAPAQAAQWGVAMATGGAAPFIIGAGVGNDKWYELAREHPEMSYSARLANASLTGLVNGTLEHITVGIIKGKFPMKEPGELKAGLKNAFLYYMKNMGIEASEEAAEQLAENTVDIATGVHGAFKDLKPGEFNKHLWNGVPESALAGATFGLPFAATAHPQLRQRAQFRHTVEQQLRTEQDNLNSIENPSDAQIQKIREIETLLDAGNLNDLANAVQMTALENTDKARRQIEQLLTLERERLKLSENQSPETDRTLSRIDEAIQNHNPSELLTLAESLDILPKEGESVSGSAEGSDLTDPQIAERNFNLRRSLPHNPQDTVDAVHQFSQQFPSVNVTVHDYLSPDLKNLLKERGMTPERVRGWLDGQGNVHVVADNVRPSEVPRVLLHEIVGHKGLKAVFGNRFESFLDGVYDSHSAEVEPFSKTYNRDPGTIENKRYLTEEFLASMAENPAKPSWWKETLQKIKMGLRKIPGLSNLRFTDKEIEAALMRSARAMRKKSQTQSNSELRFKLNQNGETLFGIAGKQLTVPEILDDPTVKSADFILADDGTPNWGLISEEMVRNAPEDLGLEPLPVRLQKGEHWGKHRGFGLVHFFNEHGSEMEKRGIDLSEYIQNVFSKVSQVYVSKRQNGNIRLELVNSGKPQNIGILELRSERGFYSVVTAFPRDISNYQLQGKKIWQYSGLPEFTGKQQTGSLEPLSTGNVAGTARVDGSKSIDNIQHPVNPFKPDTEKNTHVIQVYEKEFGNILNADNAKLLFKDEGYEPSDPKSVVKFHPKAGELVGKIFTRWLQTKKNTGDGTVTFTGGGNGSGKSSASPFYNDSDFTFDSTMVNLDAARKSIQAVLDNGQMPQLLFVYRDPFQAWNDGIKGRVKAGGHTVPLTTFANTHIKARENFRLLCEEFGDKVLIKVYETETGKPIHEISLEELDSKPLYTQEQLLEEIQNADYGTTAKKLGRSQQADGRGDEHHSREVETGNPNRGTGSQPEVGRRGAGESKRQGEAGDPDREIIFPESPEPRFSLKPSDPDIRYSISDYSNEDWYDLVQIMRPFVGQELVLEPEDYLNFYQKKNLPVYDIDTARRLALEARDHNRRVYRTADEKRRERFLYETFPYYAAAVDFAKTTKFKIRPSFKYAEREFTGTLIDSSQKGSDAAIPSEQLAKFIAERSGGNPSIIEDKIIDFFQHLKYTESVKAKQEGKLGLHDEYNRFKKESRLGDTALDNAADILFDSAAVRANAIRQESHPSNENNAEKESRKSKREQKDADKLREEYAQKLKDLKKELDSEFADAVKVQRHAADYADMILPQENRGEFIRAIIGLLKFSTLPTKVNPDGKRNAELKKLLQAMADRALELRRDKAVSDIRDILQSVKVKRNWKGIPTSILPPEQGTVDRIRQIVNMNAPVLAHIIDSNSAHIHELMQGSDENVNSPESLSLQKDNHLIETYGNLENRPSEVAVSALDELKKLVRGAKMEYHHIIFSRLEDINHHRLKAIKEITSGSMIIQYGKDAKNHLNYTLKNESLGNLLRIVSSSEIQNFDHSLAGQLYQRVEGSTQEEQTLLRRFQTDFDSALKNICDVNSILEKGKFFSRVHKVHSNSGVFKKTYARITTKFDQKTEVVFGGLRGVKASSIPIEDTVYRGKKKMGARSLIYAVDNGEAINMWEDVYLDEVSIGFLRQQLNDYDAGLKTESKIFSDTADDAQMERIIENSRSTDELVIISPPSKEIVSTTEVPLSQAEALQILLTWNQDHYKANLKWNGWKEESITQLKKFIEPDILKMGEWMVRYIANHKRELNHKVIQRYGASLPENPNYFPASFAGGNEKEIGLGRNAGTMSMNPSFLTARKFHLKPVDLETDAFSSFMTNQIEQIHFLSWTDILRDLKSIYGHYEIQSAIRHHMGEAVVQNLIERIDTIAKGGGSLEYTSKILSKFYRYWVPAKIAWNASSVIKQMFGSAAYMNKIPVHEFVRGLASANFANTEFRKFVKFAKESDYFKNRMSGGLDKDLNYLLNYTRDSQAYSPWSDALIQYGTLPTKWADAWSTLHGGYAVYKYHLDRAQKSGLSRESAHDIASREWMRATDETQQSGYLKDQNYFQANQGAFRYLTAFMTNPIQVMNLQLQTIHEIKYGKNKNEAVQKLVRQIFVNHFVVPTLMQFTTDMLKNGFDFEEYEFSDYFTGWLFGSFNSLFLWGKISEMTLKGIIGAVKGESAWNNLSRRVSALPIAEDVSNAPFAWLKLLSGEITEKEIADAIKAAGDMLMIGGTADPRLGSVGMALSAAGSQIKRLFNLFGEDK